MILQLVTVSLTSLSLVRERESGTLEQLMVSPVGRLGLMLGKLFPYSLLAMIELIGVVTIGRIVFNVQIAGQFPAAHRAGSALHPGRPGPRSVDQHRRRRIRRKPNS